MKAVAEKSVAAFFARPRCCSIHVFRLASFIARGTKPLVAHNFAAFPRACSFVDGLFIRVLRCRIPEVYRVGKLTQAAGHWLLYTLFAR